jgi:hypothetical protein
MSVEVAWAAGLFEGEGCFDSSPSMAFRPRASMSLTDYDVILRFHEIVGVGKICVIPPRKEIHKIAWQWYTNSDEFFHVYELFKSYLGVRRNERALECMKLRVDYVKLVTKERACPNCGKIFQPAFSKASKKRKWCSNKCRLQMMRRSI